MNINKKTRNTYLQGQHFQNLSLGSNVASYDSACAVVLPYAHLHDLQHLARGGNYFRSWSRIFAIWMEQAFCCGRYGALPLVTIIINLKLWISFLVKLILLQCTCFFKEMCQFFMQKFYVTN